MEHPILFSTEMVRAILAGNKTQTRRVIKPQPIEFAEGCWTYRGMKCLDIWISDEDMRSHLFHNVYGNGGCPYGGVYADGTADRLWVRETFACSPTAWVYRANYFGDVHETEVIDFGTGETVPLVWKPSIFMPRIACRIELEITDIRVQRIQEISEDDAKAEGVNWYPALNPAALYEELWNEINEKRSYGWDINPWVWAITFKRVK